MRKNHVRILFVVMLVLVLALGSTGLVAAAKPELRAGLRSSDYGINPFPSPAWWVNSIKSMASIFHQSTASSILVVVEIDGETGPGCWAHFPKPARGTYPGVRFDAKDEFKPLLDAFDRKGIKAWVQVESSGCDVGMLIDLVMRQYGRHPSVIGFGVDDEWYLNVDYPDGKPITDAEARAWVTRVRKYKASYQVFLKHWEPTQMPPTYRKGLVFIDDSQGFDTLGGMISEFKAWGQYFAPAPVGFQFGYEDDMSWWSALPNPPKHIGSRILAGVPNTSDLYWVDFTAYEIWPPSP
jgi:hypothetical protein